MRVCSNFTDCHAAVQVSMHHLLKRNCLFSTVYSNDKTPWHHQHNFQGSTAPPMPILLGGCPRAPTSPCPGPLWNPGGGPDREIPEEEEDGGRHHCGAHPVWGRRQPRLGRLLPEAERHLQEGQCPGPVSWFSRAKGEPGLLVNFQMIPRLPVGLVDRKLGVDGRTGNSSLKSSSKVSLQPAILGGGGGLVTKSCAILATPWTVACQAPLSMGFSRQEYWSGLPFASPGFISVVVEKSFLLVFWLSS